MYNMREESGNMLSWSRGFPLIFSGFFHKTMQKYEVFLNEQSVSDSFKYHMKKKSFYSLPFAPLFVFL